jgi:xyloglucan-specific endo-beta-1,4-glucanase
LLCRRNAIIKLQALQKDRQGLLFCLYFAFIGSILHTIRQQAFIMLPTISLLVAACLSNSALASPTKTIVERADLCGQYDSVSTGAYNVYNNEWGIKGATGSQCFGVDSASGNNVKWHTT